MTKSVLRKQLRTRLGGFFKTKNKIRTINVTVREVLEKVVSVNIPDDVSNDEAIAYAENVVKSAYNNGDIELVSGDFTNFVEFYLDMESTKE